MRWNITRATLFKLSFGLARDLYILSLHQIPSTCSFSSSLRKRCHLLDFIKQLTYLIQNLEFTMSLLKQSWGRESSKEQAYVPLSDDQKSSMTAVSSVSDDTEMLKHDMVTIPKTHLTGFSI